MIGSKTMMTTKMKRASPDPSDFPGNRLARKSTGVAEAQLPFFFAAVVHRHDFMILVKEAGYR